ncbi:amino acid adenylation domain-containing protein [Peterkaempfera griseoplana]|uniref:amino acid adenylation domain-containing protein n=1 Tax=Peterkaempfera griseoplana TaxID=66896 RepID=UPI0006E3FBC8|nr:amino acid adenylation domain-containing protein [Peterkaempfera griseoplana]
MEIWDFSSYVSLIDLFDDVAGRSPDAIAVVDADESATYRVLKERSEQIARLLAEHGNQRGKLIGLRVGRNVETVASILGILRSGAAYVPLDPSYPPERLQFMLEDAGARLVLDSSGSELVTQIQGRGREVGDFGDVQLAYVAYTSGSTGRPKGCAITQDNVLAFLSGTIPLFDLTGDDRWTVFHSLSFDASVWELWGALATGATAYLVPSEAMVNPTKFVKLVASAGITVVSLVTSYFKFVLEAYRGSANRASGLRHLFFVGEAIRLDLIRTYLSIPEVAGVVCANMYGPTETTVFASYKVISLKDTEEGSRSPIGVALLHAEMSIRDESGLELEPGEVGEIVIGGLTVGHGYLHQDSLTRERFPMLDGRRTYRTGDLGRQLPNGEFEFLGRIDQQIKRRGFRIEIEEIEQILREDDSVDDAVVCVCLAGAAEYLVACVVPRDADDALVNRLKSKAKARLPAVMCPDRYLFMSELPYNASGKLDRRAVHAYAQETLAGAT